jgi:2-polyprenyl-6-methoxyphenol hydroxylase-like FAD-dependent oxidoreductase
LNIRHPTACTALVRAATEAGANVLRGVESVDLAVGEPPTVSFIVNGERRVEGADLIVGADGRNSAVRRMAGIDMHREAASHLMSGLLVGGAPGWPVSDDAAATVGDLNFIGLPMGDGLVRLYVNHALDTAPLFSGPDGARRLIDAFTTPVIPQAQAMAGARPAGPCATFRAEDTWCPTPYAPGVVLVGDAAGYVDPIAGQGLSVALRDVRAVSEALAQPASTTAETFAGYEAERLERMRRVRFVGNTMAAVLTAFGPECDARRLTALARMQEDQSLGLWFAALFVGPDNVPRESFDAAVSTRLFAA